MNWKWWVVVAVLAAVACFAVACFVVEFLIEDWVEERAERRRHR